ncbi:peptidylprolyl isomerase [Hyalangium rubrum]|uniref:Peptidylprolyl isomerase n=1 Tax=Hyalangium rubrum TaxID=3103134 RepID=A0ABU5H181_9BACT|nr:peptidylprolyl isomerase [Hyalangium sp. s54d21]MDY7227081.1 peptidylprolyl isomerase [Hyalangium sp. s54d21]
MRLSRLLSFSALSFLLLSGCDKKEGSSSATSTAPKQGTPVVTWQGGSITLEELQGHVAQMNPAARARVETPEKRREYAEGLGRFELFAAEARRRGLESDPEVQEAMKRAMVQRLLFKEFDEKAAAVTNEDIAAYYESHKAEFVQPARSRYSHLLVPAPKGSADRAAKKKQAQALLEKVRALQPLDFDGFDALISEASGDPAAKPADADTHLVTADDLKTRLGAEVATAAGQLKKVGDLSPLVESDKGFHLLKLTDLRPEKNQSLEAVTSMLRARITRERRDVAVAKFTEELQERASFRTDEAALQKLQVDPKAPQAPSSGPVPGYLPAPTPIR